MNHEQNSFYNMLSVFADAYYCIVSLDCKTGKYMALHKENPSDTFTEEGKQYENKLEENIVSFVHPEDQYFMKDNLRLTNLKKYLENSNYLELEYRRKILSSDYRFIRLVACASEKKDKTVCKIMLGFLDITDKKQSEMAVRFKEKRLTNIIEVQNERLQKELIKANHANEAKSRFINTISYELRTPMNVILGLMREAREQIPKPLLLADSLEKTIATAESMDNLLDNLLDLKCIENGYLHAIHKTMSIRNMVDRIGRIVKLVYQDKRQQFVFDTSAVQNDIIETDELRLQQILLNLLKNAIQFTKPGGKIMLYVSEIPSALEATSRYCFSVEDNGIGMTPEQMELIFEPFVQTENTNGENGSGIGLYIVKSYVDLLQGEITVKSKTQEGTSITVIFHFGRSNVLNLPKEEKWIVKFPGKRILIVEDHFISLMITKHLLDAWQVEYEVARNGQEAIQILERNEIGHFHCVLMDLHLPIMKGDEATVKIRKNKREYFHNIPIIAMTADVLESNIKHALAMGMNDHIAKPINPIMMNQCLQKWIL